ncbi:MobC family plasmid mobilization relaxosome protein [Streptomyces mexicanus]|uniref:MobC family plasmid mobilization relaxosome protein n=1 Tax=Streptomyces mexicanus TaxID=178566 RepID=A0A7X1I7R3_9ACTN|nr:MobC family plasmid mobilization relaxosome protein [Streptomyces mexicanus]MBC2869855.1 MobC family plasmid mobilization relaxosome protein [Streptomyces mexicanus]
MAEQPAADGRRRVPKRRREREPAGRRTNRFLVSYNDSELAIVTEAATRDNQALASWVSATALSVAKEKVIPVSVDARDVLVELIQARNQVSRIGNNVNQIAKALNADGTATEAQLKATMDAIVKAIQRMDEATLQVMRERQPRS